MAKSRPLQKKAARKVVWNFPFERKNWVITGIGVATIIVGYLVMHFGAVAGGWDSPLAISVAPLILVIGFIVIIPYGIMWRPKTPPPGDGGPQAQA